MQTFAPNGILDCLPDLTPWDRVFLKLVFLWLAKKFIAFHVTRRLITMFDDNAANSKDCPNIL
jgi:hypothetical protein